MLTGQGLIGKLVYFLATKLIEKKLDLALDDKKRACRAFVELYYCTDKLEDITNEFLKELKRSKNELQGGGLPNLFALHGRSLDALSSRFLEIGAELHRAVELYDETLADTVDQLFRFKYSFLYFAANSIEILPKEGERNRLLKFPVPSARVLDIDMESYYQWVKTHKDADFSEIYLTEWPANVLAYSIFGGDFPEVTIEISDPEAVAQFSSILEEHGKVLSQARQQLREFVKDNFSIEDVLYVSKSLKPSRYD
ncbi:MAG TPA: hypothetical protein VIN11_01925 [Roseivirga sp.]